jgi:GAF domain-containing protein
MADQTALKRAFADYARTIARRYEIGEVLYRLTDQVAEVLEVDGAGVSLGDAEGNLQFVTATDQPITRAEEGQIEAREGPCHDAFHSGDPVTVADLAFDSRWPGFRTVALGAGLHAVAGIPMLIGERAVGAINIYNGTPREWPADDIADAQLLGDMAAGYIANARNLSEKERLATQLQHALDSRVVIEQAKGVIAERHQIATAAAFNFLRTHARSTNTKIHEVARAVVERRLQL